MKRDAIAKLGVNFLIECMNGILFMFSVTSILIVTICVQNARASDLIEGAKTIGGMGTTELLALIALANAAALVAVVKVFVGRFLKSMDALTTEMRGRPCFYLKHHKESEEVQ